jgi:hypothetical protein
MQGMEELEVQVALGQVVREVLTVGRGFLDLVMRRTVQAEMAVLPPADELEEEAEQAAPKEVIMDRPADQGLVALQEE